MGQKFRKFDESFKENSFTSNPGTFYWVEFKLSRRENPDFGQTSAGIIKPSRYMRNMFS